MLVEPVLVEPAGSGRTENGDSMSETLKTDAVIIGGSLSGLTTALALDAAGIASVVVDRTPIAAQTRPGADGRTTAVALSGKRMLVALGVWDALEEAPCPIDDIRVQEGGSRLFLHYDHREVGDEPMGYIVDNVALKRALVARVAGRPTIRLLAPAEMTDLERGAGSVLATLAGGFRIEAALAVAADGRGSPTRRAAGIRTTEWSYGQSAITCTVAHGKPHRNVAYERFLPAGPFAMLPLCDDAEGRHRSCLVWTDRSAAVPALMALSETDFDREMERRFGDDLGRLHVVGRRWAYPLGLINAERYVDRRLVLVGDAAHGIHPIAGQGFNLGLRDIAALADVLADARRLGLDIGSPAVLEKHQRWRRFDCMTLILATDGLNRLFSNDSVPLRLARDLGLGLVQRVGPLKRLFIRHAMGTLGDLPRLLDGISPR